MTTDVIITGSLKLFSFSPLYLKVLDSGLRQFPNIQEQTLIFAAQLGNTEHNNAMNISQKDIEYFTKK